MTTGYLRESKFYGSLNNYLAIAYAEGFCEGENASEHELLCAWQYLIDNELCRSLQGFFGRTTTYLIDNGFIERQVRT